EVYISVVKCLFLHVIYPTQDEIKESLKDYLNKKFPEFMVNLSANDFANRFYGMWCTQLLQKMKNLRGSALQNVRLAIWSVFGCERLPHLRSNASAEDIVRTAFTMAAAPTLTNHHCAFTLAVCNIILNPQSKNIVCSKSRIKHRMVHYLNDFDNSGPNQELANSIINNKLASSLHEAEQSM
ncbi:5437_t:CDS:2, partial [Paraglomus occultum]